MMARMFSFFCRPHRIGAVLLAGMVMFAACGVPSIGEPDVPEEPSTTTVPAAKQYIIFPGQKKEKDPDLPKPSHLAACESNSDCFGGTACLNLFGEGALCFFKCDPTKGSGDKQNPNCIEPENCIQLNDGSGVCVSLPGQLYGIGSYKAVLRHKQGDKCLLRYDGCESGLICVDTSRNGSIGTCEESCDYQTSGSKVKVTCQTAGTKCVRLFSGVGACLK